MSNVPASGDSSPQMPPAKSREDKVQEGLADDSIENQRPRSRHRNPFAYFLGNRKWHDDRYEHFVSPCLEDFPQGYPRLAAHANSDIDTLLFRRFGWLRCRALLHVQDELQVLETNLRNLDQKHGSEASHRLMSKRIDETFHDEGIAYTRTAMMNEIKSKLKEYDDLLARQHAISSRPKPGKREFRSYFDWIINDPPVVEEELQFVYHKDDFLALGEQADSWLGPLVDGVSHILPDSLQKVSCIVILPAYYRKMHHQDKLTHL